MSWIEIVASYGLAYLLLSVCGGLVVGRLFRIAGQTDFGDATRAAREDGWFGRQDSRGVLGSIDGFEQAH